MAPCPPILGAPSRNPRRMTEGGILRNEANPCGFCWPRATGPARSSATASRRTVRREACRGDGPLSPNSGGTEQEPSTDDGRRDFAKRSQPLRVLLASRDRPREEQRDGEQEDGEA